MIDRDKLAALHERATKEPLESGGEHFVDGNYDDLTQCHHGDTGHYRNRADGELVACLWNNRAEILAMMDERDRLREANGILEDALQEVGDDYPGSSCQQWCQQQVKLARAALGE